MQKEMPYYKQDAKRVSEAIKKWMQENNELQEKKINKKKKRNL